MQIDPQKLFTIAVEGSSFIAAFAAIAAGVLMSQVTKKFGTGILAAGFKKISIGVFLIAVGIIVDILYPYTQLGGEVANTIALVVKEGSFVLGTYIIVIGTKNTGDKLESLTR